MRSMSAAAVVNGSATPGIESVPSNSGCRVVKIFTALAVAGWPMESATSMV